MIVRIASFLIVVLMGIFLPFWAFACGAGLYALFYTPYELLIAGVYIDAQFGDAETATWFVYTLTAVVVLSLSIVSKPYVRFYT